MARINSYGKEEFYLRVPFLLPLTRVILVKGNMRKSTIIGIDGTIELTKHDLIQFDVKVGEHLYIKQAND